jgi:hypothetical protein
MNTVSGDQAGNRFRDNATTHDTPVLLFEFLTFQPFVTLGWDPRGVCGERALEKAGIPRENLQYPRGRNFNGGIWLCTDMHTFSRCKCVQLAEKEGLTEHIIFGNSPEKFVTFIPA